MVASRTRPKGAKVASFGLATLAFVLAPSGGGSPDYAAAQGQQPAIFLRWRQPLSTFGTIHAATYTYTRPIGTAMPEPRPIRLASLSSDVEITGSLGGSADGPHAVRSHREPPQAAPVVFPEPNRGAKGDLLIRRAPAAAPKPATVAAPAPAAPKDGLAVDVGTLPDPVADVEATVRREAAAQGATAAPAVQPVAAAADDDFAGDPMGEIAAAVRFAPFPEFDISLSLEMRPQISQEDPGEVATEGQPDISLLAIANDPDPSMRNTRLFFGGDLLGFELGAIEPWAAGDVPVVMVPPAAEDPDLKRTATLPKSGPEAAKGGGQTVAGKGQVTGEGHRPKSPAERLHLTGKRRDRAEKCLANAVYFEARSEPVRGQIAVAQVVMNRAFSGFYPNDVCGVVYQNAHRHLACQFTFACDGIRDVVTERAHWARAMRIAKATLDGKIWLPEIGKATHYHAVYVRPWWVRNMRKLKRIGLHTFYRPRKWGDGSDAPSWGTQASTAEIAPKL